MTRVSVSKLKSSLSEFLSGVREGKEVLVTDRGIPVAKLVPVTLGRDSNEGLAELIRAGIVRAPKSRKPFKVQEPSVKDAAGRIVDFVLEERERE